MTVRDICPLKKLINVSVKLINKYTVRINKHFSNRNKLFFTLGISRFMTCFFQQLLWITCQCTFLNLVRSVLRHVNLFITFLHKLHLDNLLNIIIIIIITISSSSQLRHLFFPFYYLSVTAFFQYVFCNKAVLHSKQWKQAALILLQTPAPAYVVLY